MPDYAMTGASTLQTTFQIAQLITAFAGIALYNVVELLVLIAITFRQRKGLYFWSLVVSTTAIVPYTLGLLFKFFGVINVTMLCIALIDVGWQCMVTGQSVVLYSRLHLVASSKRKLKLILTIIIVNFFISNVPTTVFVFGSVSAHNSPFLRPYAIWERVQLCCYFVQEAIISGLYVFEIARILKPDGYSNSFGQDAQRTDQESGVIAAPRKKIRTARGRRVMKHLLYVNIVIVILDITLLVTEFIGHYEIQVLYKALVYSMKLKLEFRILNQLTEIAQEKLRTSQAYFSAQSESLASPLATSGIGGAPPWSDKDGSPSSPGTPRRDSRTQSLVVERAEETAGANASRRFSQTDGRMANIDESTIEGQSATPTRPSPVRLLTAPCLHTRREKSQYSMNARFS